MDSVWTETASLPRFEPIDGDKTTDVLVIGGGIAGILCAHQLTQAGVDCLLVEAENLCGGWEELRSFAKQYFPEGREVSHWATQDCMSLDGMAYIGQYSAQTPELYVATGFNKWGMTTSMAAAILLTSLVQGKCGGYADLFSPSRTMLRPQLGVNAVESALHLLTPTTPRCPHLGCALHYNRQEHSWDCPCHGSRFTEDGRLIDNPATGDLEEEDD